MCSFHLYIHFKRLTCDFEIETSSVNEAHNFQLWAVVIVWLLDLQLPVQAVPSTANFMGSNPVYGEMYSIQHYVIKFVGDLWQVGGFLRVLRFFPQIKLTDTI
jgi:hypothetical protein